MPFPIQRPRRLRRSAALRGLVCESRIVLQQLVMPLFVIPGEGLRQPIASMPGQFRYSADTLVEEARELTAAGLRAVLIFGLPETKDPMGSGAYAENAIVPRAVSAVKAACPDLCVMTDVCLCEYTDHGHCGVLRNDGAVDNDATLELLSKTAVAYARAGADVVAPSDMMDGRVGAIRAALDSAGFDETAIMAYSAKYASALYGPFREAADCAPKTGDRSSYQMDPPNAREAMREMALDIGEGADILMIKPALPYLDILHRAAARFDIPLAAYQVSGEYAMLKAAAEHGWLEERRAALEMLTGIRRAGADIIITYWAKAVAGWLG